MSRLFGFMRAHLWISGAALLVVLAGGWYAFGRGTQGDRQILIVHPGLFAEQVSVSGTVVAAQDVDLGFAESGRVSYVYASVGAQVLRGATLAEIENGDLRALVAQKQAALAQAQATLASLRAGTRSEQLAIDEADVASKQSSLMDAIQSAYTAAEAAVHNSADLIFNNPRSSNPQLIFTVTDNQLQTRLVTERLTIEGTLTSWHSVLLTMSGSTLVQLFQQAQSALAAVTTLLADGNSALNQASAGATSQSTINADITSIAAARTSVDSASGVLNTAITALTSARKTLALALAGSTSEDIAAQQALVDAAAADVLSAQAQLQKTIVSAPFSGTVTKMDAKVGSIVSQNSSEISMISNGVFQIETYVPEVNIASIAVGNDASTTLDAYPGATFAARVIAIDPGETVRDGTPSYKTTLQFAQADARIRSGMTASVLITTRSAPNALVVPQGAVFTKNGQSYVQVERGGTVEDAVVSVDGALSLGNVQVTSGLVDGDRVVLNPDTSK
ncbi:MAG: efflux RND transporter periplasmic adaptor subunit [Patescibacteria group bacterium]|nr:efflux RND transporter periplasmic adaptor subunit [Patescibacteria group bacterium]